MPDRVQGSWLGSSGHGGPTLHRERKCASAAERRMSGSTIAPSAPWLTIPAVVRDQATRLGDKEAFVFDDGRLTYSSLDERSDVVAAALWSLGVRHGERVAALLYNGTAQLLAWIGANKIGAIYVPLNVSLGPTDLAHALQQSAPAMLFLDGALQEVYAQATAAISGPKAVCLVLDPESSSTWGGIPRSRNGARVFTFGDIAGLAEDHPDVDVSPADAACILFTGGTTGRAKGVVRPHFSYLCSATRFGETLEPHLTDRYLSVTQMFHCAGQELGIIGPLVAGIPSRIVRWFSVSRYWDEVHDFLPTLTDGLGPMANMLLSQPESPGDADNSLRLAWGATQGSGGTATREAFERRFGLKILELYASTETGTLLVSNRLNDEKRGSVGKPRGWCELAVVNEFDQPVASGEQGEIVIRPTLPYSMGQGYFGNPDATLSRWRNLWLHTGDLGRIDDDGWLYYDGRMDYWIRRKGENISCAEVEEALVGHPGVADCAVTRASSDVGEDEVKAYVVPNEQSSIVLDDLARWCTERIAYFKVPRYFEIVDEIPRTVTKGEIRRNLLMARDAGSVWDVQERTWTGTISPPEPQV